jgi:PAS domain S-box-containing protein
MDKIYRNIVKEAPDAVVFSDNDGIIRLWNRGAETMFGYPAKEAIGQSLDLIIPERLRERHWDGYRRVMATGETNYGTNLLSVPALHRNGQQLSCEFSIVLIKDKDGKIRGIASIMRDVTARWQKEKALKERLTALEKAIQRNSGYAQEETSYS